MTQDSAADLRGVRAYSALARIFERIVASHPSDLPSTVASRTPEADRVQRMIDAALGQRPRRGPPPLDLGEILTSVAELYFQTEQASPGSTKLDNDIWQILVHYGADPDEDAEAKGNAIRPVRAAFNRHKELLRSLFTYPGHQMWDELDQKIEEILRLMDELGIFDPAIAKGLE